MKNTVLTLQKQKEEHDKIVMVTAYDYTTAKIMDEAGVNTILVGDSLGMVMLGYEDTALCDHGRYDSSHGSGFTRCKRCICSCGYAVYVLPDIRVRRSGQCRKTDEGRPRECGKAGGWCGICTSHRGDREGIHSGCGAHRIDPQSVNAFGGFKVQGKMWRQRKSFWPTRRQWKRQVPAWS